MSDQDLNIEEARCLQPEALTSTMKIFSNQCRTLVFPQQDRIHRAQLREQARVATMDILARAHLTIHDFVSKHSDVYGTTTPPTTVVHSTPEEIQMLLELA